MESRLFETYLENTQKNLFIYASKSEFDVFSFIKIYMKSNICEQIDSTLYSFWQHQTPERIFDEIISIYKIPKKINKVNSAAVEWLGYFYRKWHFLTGDSSKIILRYLSPEQGVRQFYELHQIDEYDAIERVKRRYNYSRNTHRKYETKGINYKMFNHEDEKYYSFLAKKILYRLTREEKYKRLQNNTQSSFDLYSEVDNLGINIKVARSKFLFSNIDKLLSLPKIAHQTHNSILFCFVLFDEIEFELEKVIKIICSKNTSNLIGYDYIYVYSNGVLFEINQSNEVHKYYLPLSIKEDAGIKLLLKKS